MKTPKKIKHAATGNIKIPLVKKNKYITAGRVKISLPQLTQVCAKEVLTYLKIKENREKALIIDVKGDVIKKPLIKVAIAPDCKIAFSVEDGSVVVENPTLIIRDPDFPGNRYPFIKVNKKRTGIGNITSKYRMISPKRDLSRLLKNKNLVSVIDNRQTEDPDFPGIKLIIEKSK